MPSALIPRQYLAAPEYGLVTPGLSQALRCGEYIFIGGTTATAADGSVQHPGDSVQQTHQVLERLEKMLSEFGATRHDLVKLNNWFVIGGTAEQWTQSAKVRADFYPEPGPVATGHPLSTLGTEGTDCWVIDGKSLPQAARLAARALGLADSFTL